MAPPIPPSLARLNLTRVVASARKKHRWSAKQAREAEVWYRRFLELSYRRGRAPLFVIGEDADRLWHEHILHTRKYQDDTKRIFGRYLDHTPTPAGSRKLSQKQQKRAVAVYMNAFGEAPAILRLPCYTPPKPGG
jgi:hypothetical protein